MELFHAHNQWKTRPDDQRFPTIQAVYDAAKGYASTAVEREANVIDLRAVAESGDVMVHGKQGIGAKLTNWAFGQLANRIGAPAGYLRSLPATLAVQNLNHGLATQEIKGNGVAKLLFHANGSILLRAITSDRYERIWNWEVAERLLNLGSEWEPAVPDIRITDVPIEKQTALYVSDHDMFCFLRSRNVTVNEEGTESPVYRGVIVENSEVGASALKMTRFLYREMCGNHIIWGASKVVDLSVRHVGDARERWSVFAVQAREWAEDAAGAEEAMIARAKHTLIAGTKEDVLDALFGKRSLQLSRKALDASYEAVVPEEDGDPRSAWGFVQGVTRYSQTVPHADERTKIDRAGGRILDFQF